MNNASAFRPTAVRYLALLALVALGAGCTTVIVPPSAPAQPVRVFLLDHGNTPSLVLPAADGAMTRYAYGDWNWYALRNTGVRDGARALFWPTQGTLGRHAFRATATERGVRERLGADAYVTLLSITVGSAEVERLRSRLDEEHRTGAQAASVTAYGFEFVPHPRRYTFMGNSNHAVAGWLRELGCETRGLAFLSRWRLEPE